MGNVLARQLEEAAAKLINTDDTESSEFYERIKDAFKDIFGLDLEQIPILGDLLEALDTAFGQVLDLFQGLVITPINSAIGAVKDWFTNLLGFRQTTTQEIADTQVAVTDVETRVVKIQEIFDVTSSRSLADGLDPTGESTFRYEKLERRKITGTSGGQGIPSHDHGAGTYRLADPFLPVTRSITLFGFVRQGLTQEKAQATWIAYKVGTVTDFRIQIHFMDRETGDVTRHFVSPNMSSELITSPNGQWMQIAFPGFTPEMGDIVGAEFAVDGSGTVMIAGIELLAPLALPGFRPYQIGAVKPNGNWWTSYTDDEMFTYASGLTPYVQFGSNVGQIGSKRNFRDDFERTGGMGSYWILRRLADATDDLQIVQVSGDVNYVRNPSSQLIGTWADAQYVQPLATDHVATSAEMMADNTSGVPSILILNGNGGFYSWVQCVIYRNKTRITTCVSRKAEGWTVRAEVGIGCGSTWSGMQFEYDPATRTYRVLKNGSAILSWADSGMLMPTGPGYRYPGFAIDHFSFESGPKVRRWRAWDI